MAYCSLQQKKIRDLISGKALTESMVILDEQKVRDAQAELREELKGYYSKSISNPLGKIEGRTLERNQATIDFEREVYKKAIERYGNIRYGEESSVRIPGDVDLVFRIEPITLAQTLFYNLGDIKVAATAEGMRGNVIDLNTLTFIDDKLGMFFHDVKNKNFTLLSALDQAIVDDLRAAQDNVSEMAGLVDSVLPEGIKENFESLVEKEGSPVQKKINRILNLIMDNQNWDVELDNPSGGFEVKGNTTESRMSINIKNIAIQSVNEPGFIQSMIETFIHEKVHMATISLMDKPEYQAKMEELFEIVKEHPTTYREYGASDIFEFAAEALSNPVFQEHLSNIVYEEKQDGKVTLLEKFIQLIKDMFSSVTGGDAISKSVLEEVILNTTNTIINAGSNFRTNRIARGADWEIFRNITKNGHYAGTTPKSELFDWANRYGVIYRGDRNEFGVYADNGFYRLTKAQLDRQIHHEYNKYFTEKFMNGDDIISKINLQSSLKKTELNSVFSGSDEILGDIDTLKEIIRNSVIAPADQPNGKYQVSMKEYFRTTAFLGFSADDTDQLLKNASRIGNVMDELGKRVFRGDALEDITYSSVNEFVKEERLKREKKEETSLDEEQWEKDYRNPVSEESFDILKKELAEKRDFLMENYDIKKFHVDIIGWDDERLIAGEIDVLAEHNDGTFRVIDLKSRRNGLEGYDGVQVRTFNSMNKHIKQTNTYSMFLHNMGFNMRPPMIVMAQPIYEGGQKGKNGKYNAKHDVDNAEFKPIDGDDYVTVINLPLYDLDNIDEQLFDYKVHGAHDPTLSKHVEGARVDYKDWYRKQRSTREKANKSKFATDDVHKEKLKKKLSKLSTNVKRYLNLLKNEVSDKTTFSSVLKRFDQKLERELGKQIEDVVLAEQIVLAEEFLEFAANRFSELIDTLESVSESSIEEMKDTYSRIKRYQEIKVISKELFDSISAIYHNAENEDVYIQLKEKYKEFEDLNTELQIGMRGKQRSLFINIMTDSYLGSKAEIRDDQALRRKYEAEFKDTKSDKKREKQIQEAMNKEKSTKAYKDKIAADYAKEIEEMLDKPHLDMSSGTYMVNADPSISNDFTQLMHAMLTEAEHEYTQIANEELIALQRLYKDTKLSRKDLRGIVEKAEDGQWYLKGEYKIEFYNEVQKWRKKLAEANEVLFDATDKKEIYKARAEIRKISKDRQKWIKANTEPGPGYSITPKKKWRTDLNALSADQKKALKFFTEVSYKSAERTEGRQSLVRPSYIGDATFVKLPGSLKTTLGYALDGDIDGARKKSWRSLTQIEKDDTEEGAQYIDDDGNDIRIMNTGLDGEVIYTVPIFYRNAIKDKEQNLDLFTVYALEIENTIRYKVFNDVTKKTSIFMDVMEGSEFYKTSGVNGLKVGSKINGKVNVFDTISGKQSVAIKQVQKMLEQRVYNMTRQYAGKIFKTVDVQRTMDTIGAYSAYASMSFKVLSAANNFITGKVSNFVEAAGGEFYNLKDVAKAEAVYWSNLPALLGDFGKPIKESYLNQLSARYDAADGNMVATNQYERTNMLSRLAKPETSFALYSMGEHEINNTVMMSVLSGRKIIDKEGNYLDKEGKITSDKAKAASLLDVYKLNKDGVITREKWAEYTDLMPGMHLDKGGEVEVRELVKDRIFRTQGAYDQKMQAQVNRLWWGRLFSQFRKHMPPQMLNRFRGITYSLKKTGAIPESAKYFNLQAKTEEYGYHTSFIRFLANVIKQARFDVLQYKNVGSDEWSNISVHERANIVKSITEINYIITTLILASMAAAAATEDKNNEALWTLAYLLRRQRADSGLQYVSPEENWRLLESPMAALRVLQNAGSALAQIANPGELYKGGKNHGKSKLLVKMRRAALLDRLDQFEDGYSKSMYNLFNR